VSACENITPAFLHPATPKQAQPAPKNAQRTPHGARTPPRAEQSRAEQSRAEQSRAEQSRAEQSRAEQSEREESAQQFAPDVDVSCGDRDQQQDEGEEDGDDADDGQGVSEGVVAGALALAGPVPFGGGVKVGGVSVWVRVITCVGWWGQRRGWVRVVTCGGGCRVHSSESIELRSKSMRRNQLRTSRCGASAAAMQRNRARGLTPQAPRRGRGTSCPLALNWFVVFVKGRVRTRGGWGRRGMGLARPAARHHPCDKALYIRLWFALERRCDMLPLQSYERLREWVSAETTSGCQTAVQHLFAVLHCTPRRRERGGSLLSTQSPPHHAPLSLPPLNNRTATDGCLTTAREGLPNASLGCLCCCLAPALQAENDERVEARADIVVDWWWRACWINTACWTSNGLIGRLKSGWSCCVIIAPPNAMFEVCHRTDRLYDYLGLSSTPNSLHQTTTREANRAACRRAAKMSSSPGGFAHAPVTKGLLLASGAASLIQHAARTSHAGARAPLLLRGLGKGLAFSSPSQLLFGCLLLYQFRCVRGAAAGVAAGGGGQS